MRKTNKITAVKGRLIQRWRAYSGQRWQPDHVERCVSSDAGYSESEARTLNVADWEANIPRHELQARTGIGIPHDQMDMLFTAFSQADRTTTRRFGGTGLGPTISKKLVELMGGTIGAKSEPGVGTLFWVTLPFEFENATDVAPDATPGTSSLPEQLQRPLRILLAEDNRINRMLVRSMLQKLGHTVREIENGRQALKAVIAEDVDLVLMDMQMPEMDGEEATRAIRALAATQEPTPGAGAHRRCHDRKPRALPFGRCQRSRPEADRLAGLIDGSDKPCRPTAGSSFLRLSDISGCKEWIGMSFPIFSGRRFT